MPIETKDLKAGLAFIQDGKRVAIPKKDNYAVSPVAGGQFVKANGQDILKDLRDQFPGCQFLWLAKPFNVKADKNPGGSPPNDPPPET